MAGLRLDARQAVRLFYTGMTAAGVVIATAPALRERLVDYGSRVGGPAPRGKGSASARVLSGRFVKPAVDLVSVRVPHGWFVHFYIVAVASSVFWGLQIASPGQLLQVMAGRAPAACSADSMSVAQVWLVWSLMLIQAVRRLGESLFVTKAGTSTMPVSIYATGVSYYLFVTVAVWVDGIECVLQSPGTRWSFEQPSASQAVWLACFLVASALQYDCHRHLASLKKYTLPDGLLFRYIICPHYTMECLIYLSMAFLAAPPASAINSTLLLVVAFIVVNLGGVADSTLAWSKEKYGKDKVSKRWRMIPGVW